jgi:hypothetical protein
MTTAQLLPFLQHASAKTAKTVSIAIRFGTDAVPVQVLPSSSAYSEPKTGCAGLPSVAPLAAISELVRPAPFLREWPILPGVRLCYDRRVVARLLRTCTESHPVTARVVDYRVDKWHYASLVSIPLPLQFPGMLHSSVAE